MNFSKQFQMLFVELDDKLWPPRFGSCSTNSCDCCVWPYDHKLHFFAHDLSNAVNAAWNCIWGGASGRPTADSRSWYQRWRRFATQRHIVHFNWRDSPTGGCTCSWGTSLRRGLIFKNYETYWKNEFNLFSRNPLLFRAFRLFSKSRISFLCRSSFCSESHSFADASKPRHLTR